MQRNIKKSLSDPIRYIKGVGPKRAKIFSKAGIETVEDLLYYFPRRYEDRTKFSPISELKEGEVQTIKGKIVSSAQRRSFGRRTFSITEATIEDATGKIACVWFNQPYLKDYFKIAATLIIYGKTELYGSKLQISSPEFELISSKDDEPLNVGRIVPVYALLEGVSQRYLRRIIKEVIDTRLAEIIDFLHYDIRSRNDLLNLAKSLINIHYPQSLELQKEAYRRLAFEEFFLFQIPLVLRKLKIKEKRGIIHRASGGLADSFVKALPFSLTSAQERVISEIRQDMAAQYVMHRLLQGDVGSGKTIVSTTAALIAIQGGYQAAFMVPTEILAKQHYGNIILQFAACLPEQKAIRVGLLVSSLNTKEKKKLLQEIKSGKIDLVIGTHALLEEKVEFKKLGLVIIDEQHKFGVGQRALLSERGGNPDCLIMTATPIPRTLAITLYGDLDISVINEMPPGRIPIETQWVNSAKREWLYSFLREKVNLGNQAYVVYPIIEDSFVLDLLSAKRMYQEFKEVTFKDMQVGLLHGRMKQEEQDRMMAGFKAGKIQILIATTILEVGIDIPNATVMVIEHAERFGLSQLHQLRGRIGRGRDKSFCIMVCDADSAEAKMRMDAMVKYNDGFHVAEEDLRIRGPGEFFGRRQHGLSELRIANPLTQLKLLKHAREEALRLVSEDPCLENQDNSALKDKLLQRFPEYEKLMVVG